MIGILQELMFKDTLKEVIEMRKGKPTDTDYSVFLQIDDAPDTLWLSPDISLINERGDVILLGEPIDVNRDYKIRARVHNLGRQNATNVAVKFFWRDAGIAEASSYEQLGSTVYISNLRGQSSGQVESSEPWNPSTTGHKCILVNCTHYLDPIPTGNEFNVQDRHVAQRNVSVILGVRGETKQLILKAGISKGKHSRGGERHILIRPKDPSVEMSQFKRIAYKYNLFPSKKPFKGIVAEIDGTKGKIGIPLGTNLEPGKDKSVRIKMTIPKDAKKGDTWAFVVTQENLKNKNIEGGYTILVTVS